MSGKQFVEKTKLKMWIAYVSLSNTTDEDHVVEGSMYIVKTSYLVDKKDVDNGELASEVIVDGVVSNYVCDCYSSYFEKEPKFTTAIQRVPFYPTKDGKYLRVCEHFFASDNLELPIEVLKQTGSHFLKQLELSEADMEVVCDYIDEMLNNSKNSKNSKNSFNLYVLDNLSKAYDLPGKKGARILEDKCENKLVYETAVCLDDFLDKYYGEAESLSVVLEDAGDLERN